MTDRESVERESGGSPAGFLALAVVAAAAGAAAALLLRSERRVRTEGRRQPTAAAVAGFLVGAGLTALLTPESGPATRKSLSSGLSRLKVGAIDHIERLRLSKTPASPEPPPVRSVQELGREPDSVF